MSEEILKSIESKLDVVIALMVKNIVKDISNAEAAPILRKLGFKPKQIAELIGSTPGAVSSYISDAKNK